MTTASQEGMEKFLVAKQLTDHQNNNFKCFQDSEYCLQFFLTFSVYPQSQKGVEST